MINRLVAVFLLTLLSACDGGSSPATPTPPTLPPNYSGTYSGPMLYNGGTGEVNATGRTTVTHTGSTIQFELLSVTTISGTVVYSLASGTLSGDTVTGTYHADPPPNPKPDCGIINVRTICRFSGRLMNVTVEMEPQKNCNPRRLVGELSR